MTGSNEARDGSSNWATRLKKQTFEAGRSVRKVSLPGRPSTVLLIDHSKASRVFAKKALESDGFKVITAVNGLHGIHIFRERTEEIDTVIVDLVMPHIDGIDTFLAIREIRPRTRVILTGRHNESAALDRVLKFGFAGFAAKPFSAGPLIEKVHEVMEA